ncbi:CBS domain-containing protein [Candidatus Bathyarchaeota archaeon]|nr:CBS domain-containing protein [Candidatus Bathyarchaeota archaeon]
MVTIEDLRRLRRSAGLTQKQLADKAGVSQSLIARIERGSVDPRFSTVNRILTALRAPVPTRNAKDLMSYPVEGVNAKETVRSAIEKMKRTGFSQLPVLIEGRVVGSLHESAILERIARSSNPEHVLSGVVYNLMDKPFTTVSPHEEINKVVEILSSGEPALLVVQDGLPLGIITKIDVLAAVTSPH